MNVFQPAAGRTLAQRRVAQRGFTLFELLVSITLFSLITVAVVTAIRVGAHSWEAGDSASSAAHHLRLATGIIRTHLQRAYPVVVVDGGRPKLIFEGDPGHVSFVGSVAPYLGIGGPYRISLSVVETPDGRQLVFGRELFHLGARSPRDDADESVLVDDLVEARFSYFGSRRRADARPDWYDEWRDAERLPALIRVSVTSDAIGVWPDVIVPIALDGARHPVRLRRDPFGEEEEELLEENGDEEEEEERGEGNSA